VRIKAGTAAAQYLKATPIGTRMTQIQRISADQIRVHPPNPRQPRCHITWFRIEKYKVKLIIFDHDNETIETWIN
jgi:hypothetical protein